MFLASSQGEATVALSVAMQLRAAASQSLFFVRDVHWYFLLDIHRVRDRDWLRDVHWVWLGNLNVMRYGVRYLHRDLNLIRDLLLNSVRDFLLHHHRVRLGDFHRVGLRDCHMDRDFDFVGDFLLYGNCVGFGDRVGHLLGDYDGPDVLLLMIVLLTAIYISSSVTVLFETTRLPLSHTQPEDNGQQRAYLDDSKCVRNLVMTLPLTGWGNDIAKGLTGTMFEVGGIRKLIITVMKTWFLIILICTLRKCVVRD
jgi:hypothetical protein